MLKRMRTFAGGFLAGAIFFGTVAYAATGISVDFLPIKFVFDGVEKQMPSGQHGFIYQGRTYVPLRFVSESIGKEVTWDSNTQTAYLGKKPENISAPAAVSVSEKYTNSKDGYSFNAVKGCTFLDNSSSGRAEVVGSTSIGSENLIIKAAKLESVLNGSSYDVIANISVNILKSNPDYRFISSEKLMADGFETLHCLYSQQVSGLTYYVHEYFIMAPEASYDLNFITQTEPSKEVTAVINETMNSFKALK